MAEEIKQEEKKAEKSKALPVMLKVILALVLFVVAGYLLMGRGWWKSSWMLVKGCAGPCLILAGIITLAIAKE